MCKKSDEAKHIASGSYFSAELLYENGYCNIYTTVRCKSYQLTDVNYFCSQRVEDQRLLEIKQGSFVGCHSTSQMEMRITTISKMHMNKVSSLFYEIIIYVIH